MTEALAERVEALVQEARTDVQVIEIEMRHRVANNAEWLATVCTRRRYGARISRSEP